MESETPRESVENITEDDIMKVAQFLNIDPKSSPEEFRKQWEKMLASESAQKKDPHFIDQGDIIDGAPQQFEKVMKKMGI